MKIGIFYVVSSTAAAAIANEGNYPWLKKLSKMTGFEFEVTDIDHINDYDLIFDFVGTGGTEGIFLKFLDRLPKPCFLLTTGANNSLAASMEILSYLRQHDIPGEILHGSDEFVAQRIADLAKVFKAKKRLGSFRFARVGKPSDWLISSDVDAKLSKERNGIEIVDVTMEEFFEEIKRREYTDNRYTEMIKAKGYDSKEIEEAMYIYGALRRITDKYRLDGLTVRCFDLLDTVHSTGCAALAILNSDGIYASCEGDVPALISMAVLGELTGEPVFMANPSRIDTDHNQIVFAHCTLPITMPNDFEIMTHFESQLGVAFRGHIAEGPVTVFKCNGMMDEYFVTGGELLKNLTEYNLCRTQILLKLEKPVDYFLKDSIGNHHLIVKGDHTRLIEEFFKWNRKQEK
ncbi:MAG: hypothetical protein IIW22_00980 [Erysipelotrichaceae bacterium]|nr:hypothetical protein [Erysipelotrichaceae bacterium]